MNSTMHNCARSWESKGMERGVGRLEKSLNQPFETLAWMVVKSQLAGKSEKPGTFSC